MSDTSPFDHRPDPELGRALEDALSAPDDERFARQVMAAADSVFGAGGSESWWQELTAWARPGLVAAMLLIAAGAFWMGSQMGQRGNGTGALGDPLSAADSEQLGVPVLLAGGEAPSVDAVMAVAFEY
ncbi:MAG: hypothetical protein V3T74_00685 [Gemmatimonadales bacterium]